MLRAGLATHPCITTAEVNPVFGSEWHHSSIGHSSLLVSETGLVAPSSTAFEGGLRETSAVLAISLEIGEDAALMNYSVEHFRAVDAPGEPLGYEFVPTGKVETVEAHDEAAAAAIALSEDEIDLDVVSYDPSRNLYGVAGDDEAVRVTVR
jgi:hypothetical protein